VGLAERSRAEKEFDRRRVLKEEVEAYRRLAKRRGKPWRDGLQAAQAGCQ